MADPRRVLEALHTHNGLSRDRMGDGGLAFDRKVGEVVRALIREGVIKIHDGRLGLAVEAPVIWGLPVAPELP